MSTRGHRISVLGILTVLAVAASSAAVAWACTTQSYLDLGATAGHPGDTVAVTGSLFVKAPVEIRWNGAHGPLLGTGAGPGPTTVNVTIPDAPPGTYYLHGVARDADGNIFDAKTAFTIPAADSTTAAAPATPAPTSAPAAPAPAAPAPAPARISIPSAPRPAHRHAHARTHAGHSPSRGTVGHSRPTAQAPVSPTPTSENPAVVRTSAGQRVFGGSLAPSKPSAHPRRGAHPSPTTPGDLRGEWAAAGQRQAPGASDLWKGLGAKTHGAALSPGNRALAPANGAASQFALGLGLLGLSLVAMLAGFLVAAVRRGRVLAGSRGEQHSDDH